MEKEFATVEANRKEKMKEWKTVKEAKKRGESLSYETLCFMTFMQTYYKSESNSD